MIPGKRSGPGRGTGAAQVAGHPTLDGGDRSTSNRTVAVTEPTLDDALRERDRGAENALLSTHTSWRLAAEAVVEDLIESGMPWTILTVYDRVGPPPGHHNAAGGLILKATKSGRCEIIAYEQSTRPEAHGRRVAVLRRKAAA